MRSCNFRIAIGDLKTKVITLHCLRVLRKNNATIPNFSREIFSAYAITITFFNQENERLFDSITQEKIGDHQLNPMKLNYLVWIVRDYPETNDYAKLC